MIERGEGAVRMEFEADRGGHLSIDVSCADVRTPIGPSGDLPITQARAVATALGGRLTGDSPEHLAILLPRR